MIRQPALPAHLPATRSRVARVAALVLLCATLLTGTPSQGASPTPSSAATSARTPVVLGSSVVGLGHLAGTATPEPFESDPAYRAFLKQHFESLTPENQLKWEVVHPTPDRYDFSAADAIVDLATEQGLPVRGHTLLWHQQLPAWVATTAAQLTDDELRDLLHDHIRTVVGRYAGRVTAWDVANEILDDTGRLRSGDVFLDRLGTGIVGDAFRWAHESDPSAVLFLNDYGVEGLGAKSDAYLALARDLLAEGVPLGGFGVQGHLALQYPFPSTLETNLRRFAELGLAVAITELDVRMPLAGEPTDTQLTTQADAFRRVAAACVAVPACGSVTIWGAPDAYSWVPSFFPDQGAATPFTDIDTPKPAWDALLEGLGRGG